MHSELSIEVGKRVETMGVVEATLILTVAALYFAIVTGRIGTNQLVPNAQLCSGFLKERDQFTVGLSKAVGKLKSVVSLDTFDGKAVPFEESICFLQKVRRGVGALFIVSSQVPQPRKLVDGGILKESLPGRTARARNNLDVNLNTLSRIGHLLIGFRAVRLLFGLLRQSTHTFQYPVQAFRAARIPALLEPAPQVDESQIGISSPHIPYKLQFRLCMLIGMRMRPLGTIGQRFNCSIVP